MTTFSDRLKEAMYAQNLKQIDLVHIAAENNVKLGKSHVSQYVSGKTLLLGKTTPLPQKLRLPLRLLVLSELQTLQKGELHR